MRQTQVQHALSMLWAYSDRNRRGACSAQASIVSVVLVLSVP